MKESYAENEEVFADIVISGRIFDCSGRARNGALAVKDGRYLAIGAPDILALIQSCAATRTNLCWLIYTVRLLVSRFTKWELPTRRKAIIRSCPVIL